MDRTAWVEAALTEIARVGVARLAVEPLAKSLGTTKGSFYWHFADRRALVRAALEHWEDVATRQVVEDVSAQRSGQRALGLVAAAFAPHESDRAEWMILSSIDEADVREVVERVQGARIAFIEQVLREAGVPGARVPGRARLAYATYLGYLQMRMGPAGDGVEIPTEEIAALLS